MISRSTSATLAAIQQQARELVIVSAERIAAELRLILTHASRSRGVQLLAESDLLEVVLPESHFLRTDAAVWKSTLQILAALTAPTIAVAFAALLRPLHFAEPELDLPRRVFERWKLSTDELAGIEKLLAEEPLIRSASRQPWPKLQRMLVAPRVEELLGYCEAVAQVLDGSVMEIDFCRAKLAQPPEVAIRRR